MAQADSNNSTRAPIDSTRRGFLSQAAGAVAGGTVMALATFPPVGATAAPASPLDPAFALITQHRAAQQAYRDVLIAQAELHNAAPEEILRLPRVQWGTKDGEPYYLHSHKEIDHRLEWAPDFGRTPEIRARLHAELTRDIRDISAKRTEHGLTAADDRAEELWE